MSRRTLLIKYTMRSLLWRRALSRRDASGLAWDGTLYPFESWNQDQTLASALSVSANWYFQELDRQMGTDVIRSRIREIGYGNENISGSPDSYWMESGLKISPIEQVKLLTDLYRNTFDFAPENIRAVKDSLRLSASPAEPSTARPEPGRWTDKTSTAGLWASQRPLITHIFSQ